jgi:quinol monooxygenase YgiN
MLVISGTFHIHPDHKAAAVAAMVTMQRASQAEDGCTYYRFMQDLEDPNTLHIFEQWDSDEALKAHFGAPHMAAFQAAFGPAVAGRGDIVRYEIASSGPMGRAR